MLSLLEFDRTFWHPVSSILNFSSTRHQSFKPEPGLDDPVYLVTRTRPVTKIWSKLGLRPKKQLEGRRLFEREKRGSTIESRQSLGESRKKNTEKEKRKPLAGENLTKMSTVMQKIKDIEDEV